MRALCRHDQSTHPLIVKFAVSEEQNINCTRTAKKWSAPELLLVRLNFGNEASISDPSTRPDGAMAAKQTAVTIAEQKTEMSLM